MSLFKRVSKDFCIYIEVNKQKQKSEFIYTLFGWQLSGLINLCTASLLATCMYKLYFYLLH